MPKFIPAILEKNSESIIHKINIFQATSLDTVHLDVLDDTFLATVVWGVAELLSKWQVRLEIHLMVSQPLREAAFWLELPNVERVIIRSEALSDFAEYADLARIYSRLGLAIDPETLLDEKAFELASPNYVLVMGVQSGFSGQQFNPSVLSRISWLKRWRPELKIGVDGGMNAETIPLVKFLGVDVINAASYFWHGEDFARKISFVED